MHNNGMLGHSCDFEQLFYLLLGASRIPLVLGLSQYHCVVFRALIMASYACPPVRTAAGLVATLAQELDRDLVGVLRRVSGLGVANKLRANATNQGLKRKPPSRAPQEDSRNIVGTYLPGPLLSYYIPYFLGLLTLGSPLQRSLGSRALLGQGCRAIRGRLPNKARKDS